MIEIHNPVAYLLEEEQSVRMPLVLKDKKVGFLSNDKPNVDQLFDHMLKQFPDQFQTGSIMRLRKSIAGRPASAEILHKLGQEAEIVINGVAD